MALAALATAADLAARNIDALALGASAMLDAASSAVRDAAGCPITSVSSTITVPGTQDEWLDLPGGPVTDVAAVAVDGTTVTDHKLVGDRLWRAGGWQAPVLADSSFFTGSLIPSVVTVTYTHGLAAAPADIVDLVCALVGSAIAGIDSGYASRGGISGERIDDYQVTYAGGADALTGPMEIPEATRRRLRSRFSGGDVAVLDMR